MSDSRSGSFPLPEHRDLRAVERPLGTFELEASHAFVDLDVELDLSWQESRAYRYSKLYFALGPEAEFTESQVVCFRIRRNRARHTVRVALPPPARGAGCIRLRLDPFGTAAGWARVHGARLAREDDADAALTSAARLDALKEETRRLVEVSESLQLETLPHYPESISLELQPGCNLTCGHCSSHGTPEVHRRHNRMGAMSPERLSALADELFPHLTLVNVVGRGEPLMVSDALWNQFVASVARHRVLFTVVTNGYFIERRITPGVLPHLDTLTVSIDGFDPATFAANRGGASFDKVMDGLRHFDALRRSACLPRRPKLCISWTLKKNNIREFPEFVKYASRFEPDRYYVRHLFLFHEEDAEQSLLDVPELANRYLAEAYDLLAEQGVETDCPPLFERTVEALPPPPATPQAGEPARDPMQDGKCTYIHRSGTMLASGEMVTCGVQYVATAGVFGPTTPFIDLWNGEVMRGVRRDINTPQEWAQCRDCWIRQSRYHAQRSERAGGRLHPLKKLTRFSRQAWDFRGREDMSR